jgi:hypothetical protein
MNESHRNDVIALDPTPQDETARRLGIEVIASNPNGDSDAGDRVCWRARHWFCRSNDR